MIPQSYTSRNITFDFDRISFLELRTKVFKMMGMLPVESLETKFSANKGFHVRIRLRYDMPIFPIRRFFGDDGQRIVEDLMRDSDHFNRLWMSKTRYKYGNKFVSETTLIPELCFGVPF